MASITLHYFDFFARGECARMIMRYYGDLYVDHFFQWEEWQQTKNTPFAEFGQLPRLDIDGKHLVQSYAMYRYLAQKHGAYPTDIYHVYLVESLLQLREDIYGSLMPNFHQNDDAAVANWYRDNMPRMLRLIERRIVENNNPHFFVGNSVTLADFVMFEFGYDYFLRPSLKERYEGMLRDTAPTFYQFVLHFKDSSPTLKSYLEARPERPY